MATLQGLRDRITAAAARPSLAEMMVDAVYRAGNHKVTDIVGDKVVRIVARRRDTPVRAIGAEAERTVRNMGTCHVTSTFLDKMRLLTVFEGEGGDPVHLFGAGELDVVSVVYVDGYIPTQFASPMVPVQPTESSTRSKPRRPRASLRPV